MRKRNAVHENDVVIMPTREPDEPLVGPDAIIVAIPSELKFLVELSRAQRAVPSLFVPFQLFLAKRDHHLPLALAGPVLGAPQGVMVMEKLIALGARKIWVLGWCGSLQPYLLIGDLVIPTTALCEEGTSAHYPVNKRKRQTTPSLNKKLQGALVKAGVPFKRGPVWTTDALYRETFEKVTAYGKRGLLAVEMEMSALITLAVYRSVELAGLLTVSDELFSLQWNHGAEVARLKEMGREAGRLLLDISSDGSAI